jgi:hypothetical protein
MINNDKTPDTSSPEYLERRKKQEEFRARLRKMLVESGIPEAKPNDEVVAKTDTYTISFGNEVKNQTSESKD